MARQQLDTEEGQCRDEESETVEDLPEAGDPESQGGGGAGPVKQPASGGEHQHAQRGQTREETVLLHSTQLDEEYKNQNLITVSDFK